MDTIYFQLEKGTLEKTVTYSDLKYLYTMPAATAPRMGIVINSHN